MTKRVSVVFSESKFGPPYQKFLDPPLVNDDENSLIVSSNSVVRSQLEKVKVAQTLTIQEKIIIA